ncbi:MAG TPA: helix-turn-helix domain-containing protein [Ensifer sp.]|nr:helix-turn-helix domain-containing protein [Ensifer sp.]
MLTRVQSGVMPVEKFQESLLDICGVFSAEPVKGQKEIHGRICLETRAGLEMAHVAENLQRIRRTSLDCRRDAAEHYFLIIQEEGSALMAQADTAQMLNPGDMMLIDSAKPSDFTFFGHYGRQLSLHLPRKEMDKRFGYDIRTGMYLPRTDHTALALMAVLAKTFSPETTPDQDNYLREAMYGLLGVMLHERQNRSGFAGMDSEIGGAQLLQRALAYIDSKYGNSELSVQAIAGELHVSMRQLQRAFALLGTTPTDYLLQKRLEVACQMLIERRMGRTDMLVSTIAYHCGFNDISYFNRIFRKVFDCAPGQYGE